MFDKRKHMQEYDGWCFKNALNDAQINTVGVDIPEWIDGEDVINICNQLGLDLYLNDQSVHWEAGDKFIVIRKTGYDGILHAELSDNLYDYNEYDLCGIIKL